jgi:multisubunit Na+/H+ antiporter MnhB subunit
MFQKVDIALLSICDDAERQLAEGVIQKDKLNDLIFRMRTRLPELSSLRATDAAGEIIYGVEAPAVTSFSLANRDYFKFLQSHPSAGMVISEPLVGAMSGTWIVILGRGFYYPDGAFAGMVYAGLGLDYCSVFHFTNSFLLL